MRMKLDSGSSPYFCILAAIFKDDFSADACDRAIDLLRRETGKPSSYEFHFSRCPTSMRQSFLRCVAHEQFSYHAFVLDKAKLFAPRFKNSKDLYEFAVSIVCENASDILKNAKVVIDRNGNREFLQRLQSTLKARLNGDGLRVVRKVVMQDSKANNLWLPRAHEKSTRPSTALSRCSAISWWSAVNGCSAVAQGQTNHGARPP